MARVRKNTINRLYMNLNYFTFYLIDTQTYNMCSINAVVAVVLVPAKVIRTGKYL